MRAQDDAFFIGWSGRLPKAHRGFLVGVGAMVVAGFAAMGLLLGATLDDPSRNLFGPSAKPEGWKGDQKFTGVLTLQPYPVLHVSAGPGAPVQHSILLSGSGKRGADTKETRRRVEAVGGLLRRGDIDMLVLDENPTPLAEEATPPRVQKLGTWRATGEICDGKCYPGGMTPGFGLAHRACASLCLIGDVPAIFVTASPVAGATFMLLADADGTPPSAWMNSLIARPIQLEGEVERIGAMVVFKVDPSKAKIL